jgi:hypothetical protein
MHVLRVVIKRIDLHLFLIRRIVSRLLVCYAWWVTDVLLRTVCVSLLKMFLLMTTRLLYASLFSIFNYIFIIISRFGIFFLFIRNSSTFISFINILICIIGISKRRCLWEWSIVLKTGVIWFHGCFEGLVLYLRIWAPVGHRLRQWHTSRLCCKLKRIYRLSTITDT